MSAVESLENAAASAKPLIDRATDLASLEEVERSLLGPESTVGEVRKSMGSLDAHERPTVGAKLQEVTRRIQETLESKRAEFASAAEAEKFAAEAIDVTLDALTLPIGSTHLIQQTIDEVTDIFVGLGYRLASGPEAELGYYNFDALNTPPTHPSRFESDTMYLEWGDPGDEVLLRTHTSPVQARWMETHDPPVYIVVPGKAYRTDTIDATHLPVFHQIEGLAVDENIVFSDLKGTLLQFAKEYFGADTEVRLRPHFFPFTEPSAELDISCFACDGTDMSCRVCSGAGWVELLGCGMVDPNVLEAAGYDSSKVSGFAFGMGVERIAQVRHGINDMRSFIDNDLRFLRQFP